MATPQSLNGKTILKANFISKLWQVFKKPFNFEDLKSRHGHYIILLISVVIN